MNIEIRPRYLDATEQDAMDAYRNVFCDGQYTGTIMRRDVDGRWQWDSIWNLEHEATMEDAARKRCERYGGKKYPPR